MISPNPQRDFAIQVVRQLRAAGHEALWAGGCVRDELLGREPKDYDVATSARPEQVRELFGHRRTLAIGAAFGVIAVLGSKGDEPIEVATFRSDGAYIDGRHPTEVTFTTAEEDAKRRDFTINGLFYDPIDEAVLDYVDGQRDLKLGVVCAIGDPTARFAEDKLRMLRAVRFATTFGFAIDSDTMRAMQSMASEVAVVSAERIGVELRKILLHPKRSHGLQLLQDSLLLQPVLPTQAEWAAHDKQAWEDVLRVSENLAEPSLPTAFAAIFSPSNDQDLICKQGRTLRFTNKEIDRAAWLLQHLRTVKNATETAWPQLQRMLVHTGVDELLALATAKFGMDHPGVLTCRDRLALPAEQLNPPLLLTGDDLVAEGLRPGKHFGPLLEAIRDAQLEQQISDRQQALDLVSKWLKEHPAE